MIIISITDKTNINDVDLKTNGNYIFYSYPLNKWIVAFKHEDVPFDSFEFADLDMAINYIRKEQ